MKQTLKEMAQDLANSPIFQQVMSVILSESVPLNINEFKAFEDRVNEKLLKGKINIQVELEREVDERDGSVGTRMKRMLLYDEKGNLVDDTGRFS